MAVIYFLIVFAVPDLVLIVQYNNSLVAVLILVRLEHHAFQSLNLSSENSSPSHFNLPDDYNYVENQMGSLFYKTFKNKIDYTSANNQCEIDSATSNSTVLLPIPKSGNFHK